MNEKKKAGQDTTRKIQKTTLKGPIRQNRHVAAAGFCTVARRATSLRDTNLREVQFLAVSKLVATQRPERVAAKGL